MKARENPFATSRVLGIRYRLDGWDWDELWERLVGLGCRAAIVGQEGSGKTTLLEDFEVQIRARGLTTRRLSLNGSSQDHTGPGLTALIKDCGPSEFLLLDGAGRLSRRDWRDLKWMSERYRGVLVTAHAPVRLPTLVHCRTSPDLLAGILADLLCRPVRELMPLASELFLQHNGNLRDALREMYDRAAQGSLM